MTTTTMYDSASAQDIPADAKVVAGYINGQYKWSKADWNRFPHATKVPIQIYIPGQAVTNAGTVLDVEQSDASSPAAQRAAVAWVRMRIKAGVTPVIYTSESSQGVLASALRAAGLHASWWLAQYTGSPHQIPGTVATQYTDVANRYDLSVASTKWVKSLHHHTTGSHTGAGQGHRGGGAGTKVGQGPVGTSHPAPGRSRRTGSHRVVIESTELTNLAKLLDSGADAASEARTRLTALRSSLVVEDVDPSLAPRLADINELIATLEMALPRFGQAVTAEAETVRSVRTRIQAADHDGGSGLLGMGHAVAHGGHASPGGQRSTRSSSGQSLVQVAPGMLLAPAAAKAFTRMRNAARADGVPLDLSAAYRPAPAAKANHRAEEAVRGAESYEGRDYVEGQFDCSKLTEDAYAKAGINIGRDTLDQLQHGWQVGGTGPANFRSASKLLKPGDLIFYQSGPGVGGNNAHVVMYVGHGQVIQNSVPGAPVAKTALYPAASADKPFYEIRRYVPAGSPPTPSATNHAAGNAVTIDVGPRGSNVSRWLAHNAHRFGFHHDDRSRPGDLAYRAG